MGFFHAVGQGLAVNSEAVVHRGDFNFAGFQVLNRVICPVVAVVHLNRRCTQGQSKHLVAKANTKDRDFCLIKNAFDHWHSIFAGCRRVAGTVGQENPVGIKGQNVFGRGRCWQNSNFATGACQASENIAFGAVINCYDTMFWSVLRFVTFGPSPPHFIPSIGLGAGDVFGQIEADETRERAGCCDQCFDIEVSVGIVGQGHMRRALLADRAGQAPSVEVSNADTDTSGKPGGQFFSRAPG